MSKYLDARNNHADYTMDRSAHNMHVSIYNTLSGRVKSRLHHLQVKIAFDGPMLVYYFLTIYAGDSQRTIHSCLEKIQRIYLDTYKYNIADFCAEVDKLYLQLTHSGGTDENILLLLHMKHYVILDVMNLIRHLQPGRLPMIYRMRACRFH